MASVPFFHSLKTEKCTGSWITYQHLTLLKKVAKKSDLHCLSSDIFSTCLQNNVNLYIKLIPRSENCLADFVSNMVDCDDWSVTDVFFAFIDNIWGPHTVDRFANSKNKKLYRFNSLFWNPGCESVDDFSQNWQGENNWLVPPIYLISKTIQHCSLAELKEPLLYPHGLQLRSGQSFSSPNTTHSPSCLRLYFQKIPTNILRWATTKKPLLVQISLQVQLW